MSDYYSDVRALIDPEPCGRLINGTAAVTVIMTDEWEGNRRLTLPPSTCILTCEEARELAFELLELADLAQRTGERR